MLFVKLKLWLKQFLDRDSVTWNILEELYKKINDLQRLKGSLGTLPDFLIIGVQRGGTTSLYHYLLQHPDVYGATTKQVEYFSNNYDKTTTWYRSHFPMRWRRTLHERLDKPFVTGEASTGYMLIRTAARRAKKLLPDTKIIVLLRNPVNRAYSHYNHVVKNGKENLSFRKAVEKEQERIEGERQKTEQDPSYISSAYRTHTYLTRGKYTEFLRPWFEQYDREKMMILKSENLFQNPRDTTNKVFRFLGIQEHELKNYHQINNRKYDEIDDDLREELKAYYQEYNADLEELIGRDMDWF